MVVSALSSQPQTTKFPVTLSATVDPEQKTLTVSKTVKWSDVSNRFPDGPSEDDFLVLNTLSNHREDWVSARSIARDLKDQVSQINTNQVRKSLEHIRNVFIALLDAPFEGDKRTAIKEFLSNSFMHSLRGQGGGYSMVDGQLNHTYPTN